jgi:hypothetical protein
VRLCSRNGHDLGNRFLLIAAAAAALPARFCLIDREVIVTDEAGLAVFELLRSWRHDHAAVLCAFPVVWTHGKNLIVGGLAGCIHDGSFKMLAGHDTEGQRRRLFQQHRPNSVMGCVVIPHRSSLLRRKCYHSFGQIGRRLL